MTGGFRSPGARSTVSRYLIAVGASLVATLLTIGIDSATNFPHGVAALLAAILLTGWYAGTGPAVVTLILVMIGDRIAMMLAASPDAWALGIRDVWFVVFAAGAAWFGAERHRATRALHEANERLEREVALRTQELRRKEWYLEEAERLSHVGSWTVDLGTRELGFWSDETFRIFGLPPGSAKPGADYLQRFVHPDDLQEALAARRTAIQERRSWDLHHRIVRPDGAVRYIHTVGQPYFDEHGELVAYIGCVMDVTEQRRIAGALRRSRERTMRLRFRAQLAERNRIAREMHDTLLQGFTGVALKLVATANSLGESQQSEALRDVVTLAQQTLADARNALWQIRAPVVAAELPEALRTEAQKAAQDSRLDVQVDVVGDVRPLPPSTASAVLRITGEAVTNAVRHSGADALLVKLRFGRRALRLTVTDRGRGFVVDPELRAYGGHLGLLGMRERAAEVGGRLMIESAPGEGSTIRLTIPIEPAHGTDRDLRAATGVAADQRQEHGVR